MECNCENMDGKTTIEKLKIILDMPVPEHSNDFARDVFYPWKLFPFIYGIYFESFDICAIEVLNELQDRVDGNLKNFYQREDVGSDMFREMLCRLDLCENGDSPRECFPTDDFSPLIPILIEKWKKYYSVMWEK